MTITIEFSLGNDIPLQDTTWVDYIALASVVLATALLASAQVALFLGDEYDPLKIKDVAKLRLMCFYGTMHIWGTFMAHDHFSWAREIQKSHCPLFTFWIAYFAGLIPWVVLLILRHQMYLWVFSDRWRDIDEKDYCRIKMWTIFLFVIPFGFYCLFLSAAGGEHWVQAPSSSPNIPNGSGGNACGRCESSLAWKIPLLVWVGICLLTVVILNAWVRRAIEKTIYYEYQPVESIVRAALFVIIANGTISMFGLLSYSVARTIATCLVAFLHLHSIKELCGTQMWKAMMEDRAYLAQFVHEQERIVLSMQQIKDLLKDDDLREDFITYCQHKDPVCIKEGLDMFKNVIPRHLVAFYRQMKLWKMQYAELEAKDCNEKFCQVVRTFLCLPVNENHANQQLIFEIDETSKEAPVPAKIAENQYVDVEMNIRNSLLSNYEIIKKKRDIPLPADTFLSSDSLAKLVVSAQEKVARATERFSRVSDIIFDDAMKWVVDRLAAIYGDSYLQIGIFSSNAYQKVLLAQLTGEKKESHLYRMHAVHILGTAGLDIDLPKQPREKCNCMSCTTCTPCTPCACCNGCYGWFKRTFDNVMFNFEKFDAEQDIGQEFEERLENRTAQQLGLKRENASSSSSDDE